MSLLAVRDLEVRHGLLRAVRGVGFDIEQGETVALVGANGAGKTTLLRAIAGAKALSGGMVSFDGADLSDTPAHQRAARGIALVPEGRRLFRDMTVEENLRLATAAGRRGSWTLDAVLLAFPQLVRRRHALAGTLSGGEQQATAIGRALMSNPRLLLLDEVSLGLSPVAVDGVYACLSGLLGGGMTIVLVEQDLARAMKVADRVFCMLEGEIVLTGRAAELSRAQVLDAYFGLHRAHAAA